MKKECEFFILSNRSYDLRKPLKLVSRKLSHLFQRKLLLLNGLITQLLCDHDNSTILSHLWVAVKNKLNIIK